MNKKQIIDNMYDLILIDKEISYLEYSNYGKLDFEANKIPKKIVRKLSRALSVSEKLKNQFNKPISEKFIFISKDFILREQKIKNAYVYFLKNDTSYILYNNSRYNYILSSWLSKKQTKELFKKDARVYKFFILGLDNRTF